MKTVIMKLLSNIYKKVFKKNYVGGVWPDHKPFWDEDDSFYTWTMGLRAGYTTSLWTIAGLRRLMTTLCELWND